MRVVYTLEEPPQTYSKSIFLAGPTPRDSSIPSWRPEAIKFLGQIGYDGVVYVPEYEVGFERNYVYEEQVAWEEKNLARADVILFWVPRDIKGGMPAFTTNIEWGKFQTTGRCILGCPPGTEKMEYLAADAQRLGITLENSLPLLLGRIKAHLGNGSERSNGERDVPLNVWTNRSFRAWYDAQTQAGNRLDSARVLWTFTPYRTEPSTPVFAFAVKVDMWVETEQRHKTNEFILGRPDIATVVAYHKPTPDYSMSSMAESVHYTRSTEYFLTTEVALIREFRSPARTKDGYIRECPGGSSFKGGDPLMLMAHELEEETGLKIQDISRFRKIGTRQLSGTLSVHQAHVYAVELTDSEMAYLRGQASTTHGVEEDSERTTVETATVLQMLRSDTVDWSTLGMVFQALR